MPERRRCETHVCRSVIYVIPCHRNLTLRFVFRCGNVGKLTRICATVSDPLFASSYPRQNTADEFLVLGGYADFLLPSAYVKGHGCITGLANVSPVSHSLRIVYRCRSDHIFVVRGCKAIPTFGGERSRPDSASRGSAYSRHRCPRRCDSR